MTPVVAVIGDDLTGVVSVGGEISARGIGTVLLRDAGVARVEASAAQEEAGPDSPGLCLLATTGSRHDAPAEAAQKARLAAAAMREAGAAVLLKKVDSLLRGNIAPEIGGAMEGFCAERALCVFAAPSHGRTTVGGVQLLRGRPVGADLDPGAHFRSGAGGADVLALLRGNFGDSVRLLDIALVARGPEAIDAAMRAAAGDASARLIACDIETVDQLARCTRAGLGCGIRFFVGTSDLGGALAEALIGAGTLRGAGPVLVVSGTVSEAGRVQARRLIERGIARAVEVPVSDPERGGDGELPPQEVAECARRAGTLLASGASALLRPASYPSPASGDERARAVARTLARIASESLRGAGISGLVATGGDTAEAVLESLGSPGLAVGREVIPGVSEALIRSGPHAGLRFVPKPGTYGGPDVLEAIVGWLRSRNPFFDACAGAHSGHPTRNLE
jgi:4-hydroxythreonine-4-phosphate dehydrogenase